MPIKLEGKHGTYGPVVGPLEVAVQLGGINQQCATYNWLSRTTAHGWMFGQPAARESVRHVFAGRREGLRARH